MLLTVVESGILSQEKVLTTCTTSKTETVLVLSNRSHVFSRLSPPWTAVSEVWKLGRKSQNHGYVGEAVGRSRVCPRNPLTEKGWTRKEKGIGGQKELGEWAGGMGWG